MRALKAPALCALAFLLLLRLLFSFFLLPSSTMEDTLRRGDRVVVNRLAYALREVRRGDLAAFRFPTEEPGETHCGGDQHGKMFLKRVIGLPGEKVEIRQGAVFIDGKRLEEPYAVYSDPIRNKAFVSIPPKEYQELWASRGLEGRLGDTMRDDFGPVTVPENGYFVLGDNRDRSCDGRYWGPVPERFLRGKAWLIYWPPSRMGGVS